LWFVVVVLREDATDRLAPASRSIGGVDARWYSLPPIRRIAGASLDVEGR